MCLGAWRVVAHFTLYGSTLMAQVLPLPPVGTDINSEEYRRYLLSLKNLNGTFAPIDARYWVSTGNSQLTNDQNLGVLATGWLRVTVAAGIATPHTAATIPSSDITGLPTLASGTYTPTLASVANVAAKTAYAAQYLQVGSTVTVSGKVDIDPTAGATLTRLGISLPVASDFAAAENCAGTAYSVAPDYSAAIFADATNNRAELDYTTVVDVANQSFFYSFSYVVI